MTKSNNSSKNRLTFFRLSVFAIGPEACGAPAGSLSFGEGGGHSRQVKKWIVDKDLIFT